MNAKRYNLGVLFALTNCFSLGFVGIIDKIGTLNTEHPLIFSSQSILLALTFTTIFASLYFKGQLFQNFKKITLSSWGLLILVGIGASGLFTLFRFLGLTQSIGTFATLSQIITTSLTAMFAWIFFRERLSKLFWALFLVIIFSTYFVSVGKIALVTVKTGDLLILLGAFFLAIANIFSRIAIHRVGPITLAVGRFLFGFIFLFIVGIFILNESIIKNITIWAIISGLLWSINVIFFHLAIKRIGLTLSTALLMPAPVVTMLIESTILKYQFNTVQVVAALIVILCGIGVIFASKNSNTNTA